MESGILKDVLLVIISYVGIILLFFVGTNFFSNGYLFKWLKVKISRGRLILVHVDTMTGDYFKVGRIDKGFLIFKDSNKEERRIKLDGECIYRSAGVNNIVVDDERNSITNRGKSEEISGFDAIKYNNLYLRALYRPSVNSNKEKMIMILIIITAIVVVFTAYIVYNQGSILTEILTKINQIGVVGVV